MRNSERALARIVREAAAAHGARVESLGQGWILRLVREGADAGPIIRHVHGYGFDLNPAATHLIATDKSAAAEVLTSAGVACVEHRLFLHTDLAAYVPHAGNWAGMLRTLEEHGRDCVVKDNTGTGGFGVYRVRNELELEQAAQRLFATGSSVAMSPFHAIEREVRLVMLAGRCEAIYEKVRPTVVGDGRRTALELLAERVGREGVSGDVGRWLASLDAEGARVLRAVPPTGATLLLNWRHNLGQGASVRLLDAGEPGLARHVTLAASAARALNLVFGSVDVIEVGGEVRVLEVNSGVMMEFLAASMPGGEDLARRIYGRAVGMMLEDARE